MTFCTRKKPRQADQKQVFDYACWLLARRSYSQAELLTKFRTRFIPNEEIFSTVLRKLENLGFQSDEGFTEDFVRSHAGWGSRRLVIELKRRGIDIELINKFLPNDSAELERCRSILKLKLKGGSLPEDYKDRQKLAAFLARRGFDLGMIKDTLKF